MVTLLIYILLFSIQLQIPESGKQMPGDDYYEKGIEYLEDGNWQNALNLWIGVRDSLRAINKSDFRIGQKFIEHVTATELSQLYPLASEMYLWGLQSQNISLIKKELEIEIEMLQPLIPESVYESWKKKIRQNDESVLSEIKGFWIEQNPVLDTSMNERLIEHWERIAYSREHFNKNRSSAYKTDDRGSIFVKMGEPDKIESGNFLLNNSRVQFFAREILRQQDEEVDGFGQDRISVDNRSFGEVVSDSYYRNNISKAITDRVLTQRVSSDYEVWIYENQTVGLPENLLFIFGTDANTGNYGMIQSPVDFIPVQAFRPQRIREANFQFNTGAILQLSLYDNLKYVDDKFLDIYNDLYDRLMSDQSIITEGSTSYLTHRYADELEAMRSAAPDHISIYDRELETFTVQTRTYRFFDENLSPYHLLMAVSTPHESIIKDNAKFLSTFENIEPRYHLKHTLVVHDESWTQLYSTHDFPEISFDSDDITNQLLPSSSLFRIRNADPKNRFRIYGSIINESLDEVTYARKNDNN